MNRARFATVLRELADEIARSGVDEFVACAERAGLFEALADTVSELRGDHRPLVVDVPRQRKAVGWIYFILAAEVGRIKIGWTGGRSVARRLAELQTASPYSLRIIRKMRGTQADERALHARFAELRVAGEWFRAAPELRAFIGGIGR